ncbi:PixA protein [Escherichia coli]|nr:hypothetical protein RG26_27650 [Escherichia coli]EHW97996.1 hypothetical protein ECDEC11A_5359 [Escherichia coli DEC11A]KRR54199.1 PixA protein [Escherichia coli VL2874]APL88244.1 hypothetical protein RG29_27150 [Escherichia coli]KIG94386.1 hypothetical protein PU25_23595 [Escherichia coli]
MMKSVLGIAVAIAFCSAANAADQGQGKVNFKGTVIDAPCGIAPESADQCRNGVSEACYSGEFFCLFSL